MEDNIKALVPLLNPITQTILSQFITPFLTEKLKKDKIKPKNVSEFEVLFNDYLKRSFTKLSIVNTIALRNRQVFLNDIYIPLTIKNKSSSRDFYKLDKFPDKLLDNYHNILITDLAGMGKSTVLKKIFLETFSRNNYLPIFIELRKLNSNNLILNEILSQLNAINQDINHKILMHFINEGKFIFFLDGYDEIPLDFKQIVTNDIQNFIEKSNKNNFILTSRPESSLSSFGNFQEFEITELKIDEAFLLLRKYDNNGEISKNLIQKVKELKDDNINNFLRNPLLTSLLFTAFDYKPNIPVKKSIFYSQVYDALYECHDFSKGGAYMRDKRSNLDTFDFHKLLRYIGFVSVKNQKFYFTKGELLSIIEQGKSHYKKIEFKENDFLIDICENVPFFKKDGIDITWIHKSFSEFFAAYFIESNNNILENIYQSNHLLNYINVLDLFYDIDPLTFSQVIEKNIIEEYLIFKEHFKRSIDDGIPLNEIVRRAEFIFLNEYVIINEKVFSEIKLEEIKEKPKDIIRDFFSILGEHFKPIDPQYELESLMSGYSFARINSLKFVNPKHKLLELLHNKRNDIVKRSNTVFDQTELKLFFEQNKKEIRYDIDPQNFVNKKKQFKRYTDLLYAIAHSKIIMNDENLEKNLNKIIETKDDVFKDL